MSIQHVHIIFIICSTALSVLLTVLFFANYRGTNEAFWIWTGLLTLASSVVLPAYGTMFYKKMKKMEIYK